VEVEAFNMETKYLLAEQDDCYALLNTDDVKAGDFMADMKGIYQAPEIDGFIGFLKVVACTKPKGDLPLIDEKQIFIPNHIKHKKLWVAKIEVDDLNLPKVRNGFINLIGIQIPKQQQYVR
jgi:hypothetical protein